MASDTTMNASGVQAQEAAARPYAPSWINRVTAFVDRLGPPFWFVYFVLWLALFTILTILRWRDGVYPMGTLSISDVVLSGTGIFFVALVHYLDRWASSKLMEYRWAIKASDQEGAALLYQLTVLPALPTALASLIALVFAILTYLFLPLSYRFLNLNLSTPSGALQLANFFLSWCTFGMLSYHAFRQLKMGSFITTNYLRINLFQLNPLYAFAGLALRTAAGWLIVASAWAITTPNLLEHVAILVTVTFMQIVAVVTFITPLLGAHALLEQEKARLQRDIGHRMETTIGALNQSIGTSDNEELRELNTVLSSLLMAEQRLEKTPTWPWRPGTIRWLSTAILLPLALWVIQTLMQRFFMR
ncbi:MAG: hypothetical protein P8Z40_06185 [Chloroflexota bacterium]